MLDLQLLPGFVDIGTVFGEPGHEHAETIASGLDAAARGGFSLVVADPFTAPAVETDAQVRFLEHRAEGYLSKLLPLATALRHDGRLSEMELLTKAGAIGISLGARLPASVQVLRNVLEYAAQRDMTVFVHPTEPTLTAGGVIHEGDVAERLGLRGIPGFAEEIGLGILIPLVRRTRARVHIQRISTAKGVALLRQARAEGLPLTADVGFRHLLATHEAVALFDVHWKIDPPLRTEEDRQALWAGLLDKTIDCIVSHHVPIADEEKLVEFDQSPSGAIGLETVFSALWTARGRADTANYGVDELVNWLTHGPRRVLGLPPAPSSEEEGTWWDLQAQWIPERAQMASLSGNCPEIGQTLTGVAVRLRRGGWDVEMPSV